MIPVILAYPVVVSSPTVCVMDRKEPIWPVTKNDSEAVIVIAVPVVAEGAMVIPEITKVSTLSI